MKTWVIGILFGGFLGFSIATMAFLLGLKTYGEGSHNPLLRVVQVTLIIIFGWVSWKFEGVQTLVGYVLGSFYIMMLILLPYKTKID